MNYPDAINFKELLPICWLNILDNDIVHQTQDSLNLKLMESKLNGKHIYPNNYIDLFKIFQLCSPDKIKVVILGMDPYHSNPMQANGIAFSVSNNKPPPSLRNMYKELQRTFPEFSNMNGDLSPWVEQGVFLLNTALSVTEKTPGSHMSIWTKFTDHVINVISNLNNRLIFCLWGKCAELKEPLISKTNKHYIIKSSHPSPLSAYKTDSPFIGSNVFLLINTYLTQIYNQNTFIQW